MFAHGNTNGMAAPFRWGGASTFHTGAATPRRSSKYNTRDNPEVLLLNPQWFLAKGTIRSDGTLGILGQDNPSLSSLLQIREHHICVTGLNRLVQ